MRGWTFFKMRDGDYLLARKQPIAKERADLHDAIAPEHHGKPRSPDYIVTNDRYLARCTEVPDAEVPPLWSEALRRARVRPGRACGRPGSW